MVPVITDSVSYPIQRNIGVFFVILPERPLLLRCGEWVNIPSSKGTLHELNSATYQQMSIVRTNILEKRKNSGPDLRDC